MSTMQALRRLALPGLICLSLLLPTVAVAQPLAVRVAVLDVQRILVESAPGKVALQDLQGLQASSVEQARTRQEEVKSLQDRLAEGRLSLSAERLLELEKELEAKVRDFRRFQEDVEREMGRQRDEAFAKIERQVMPIIEEVGKAAGYTLIFNKFQSGLVYAEEQIDITDEVIAKYNESQGQ